ncbi:cadherin-like beta sandwich domain-containing protein [Paenibacillus radicibacter]|uniref:cadherin-like beta sandwich domain-containing protein n=1 Tax=Paenibacillus radicibacter TaxID=2972488 RepID=UPI0021594455|nr:cadherin-like beta sandwich domain-containing protein [Paenibacillus radicibacter]
MKHTANRLRILTLMLMFVLLLSACVGVNVSQVTFNITGTLAPDEKIFIRYSDGIEANDSGELKTGEINIKTDPTRVIVGAYVSDGRVSWVPSDYGFGGNTYVSVNLLQSSPKPAQPVAYAKFVKAEFAINNSFVGKPTQVVRATYKLHDKDGQAVADGTDVFIQVPNSVTLYNNDPKISLSNEAQWKVPGGYAYFTKNGEVQFDFMLDKPGDLSQVPLKLYSGTTEVYDSTKSDVFSNSLSLLEISAGDLSPAFSPSTTSYTATVPSSVSEIAVSAEALDKTSQVKVNGQAYPSGKKSINVPLHEGKNTIQVDVIPLVGDAKPYTITVNRQAALSKDATLSGLILSSGTLSPEFVANKTEYTASVANAVSSVQVTATASDDNAELTIDGKSVERGKPSAAIALKEGSNTIPVIVTAEDGTTTKSYTIVVTRAAALNTDATLSGLALSSGTLSPEFVANKTEYTASVANAVSSVQVTATASDDNAELTIDGKSVERGKPSAAIALKEGSNTIPVIVTAEDGTTTKSYSIVITRAVASSGGNDGGNGGGTGSGSSGGGTPNPAPTTPTPSTPSPSTTSGKITIPAGKAGQLVIGDLLKVDVPEGAATQSLQLTADQLKDIASLIKHGEILASPVFELLKNLNENFKKLVQITMEFNQSLIKEKQRAGLFYYDETAKKWIEVTGAQVKGTRITGQVDHFTKFAVLAVNQEPKVDEGITLSDITGHWAEEKIKQAVKQGIVKGFENGTFAPDSTVSREDFIVMLMHGLKSTKDGAALTFTDEAQIGDWAKKAVAQAIEAGYVTGYSDGTFEPKQNISRQELAVIIAKSSGIEYDVQASVQTKFADDSMIESWAKSAVHAIELAGIVQGHEGNLYEPTGYTTRAEAITIIMSMLAQKK